MSAYNACSKILPGTRQKHNQHMDSISAFPIPLGSTSGSFKLCYMGGFPTKNIYNSSNHANSSDTLTVPKWIFGVVIAYTKFGAWYGGGFSSSDQPYQFGSIVIPGFSAQISKSSNLYWQFSMTETSINAYCSSSGSSANVGEASVILFGNDSE